MIPVCWPLRRPRSYPIISRSEMSPLHWNRTILLRPPIRTKSRSGVSPERVPLPKPENVIGTDDRTRVTTTESYPYNTVGFIGNTYASSTFRGTGFIVSPYMVLTNGHMVYDMDEGGYATQIDFSPGQRQMFEGGAVTRPYGTLSASSWQTNTSYIDALKNDPGVQFDYDYAAVFFNTSFSSVGIDTYMPLVFDIAAAGTINLAGYPVEVQGEGNSQAMWHSSGNVTEQHGSYFILRCRYERRQQRQPHLAIYLRYRPDTRHRPSCLWRFLAQRWARLVTQNLPIIETWLSWAPAGSGGDGAAGGRLFHCHGGLRLLSGSPCADFARFPGSPSIEERTGPGVRTLILSIFPAGGRLHQGSRALADSDADDADACGLCSEISAGVAGRLRPGGGCGKRRLSGPPEGLPHLSIFYKTGEKSGNQIDKMLPGGGRLSPPPGMWVRTGWTFIGKKRLFSIRLRGSLTFGTD